MSCYLQMRLFFVSRLATLSLISVLISGAARAEEDASKILKAMTDYLASQKSISAAVDTDIEIITPELQKIQFASSSQLVLSRPDKLRVSRVGGYAVVDLVFDGKVLSILGKNLNTYIQLEAAGSTDDLIDRLRLEHGMEAPGADLLLATAYDDLMEDVVDAKYIGHGVVGGIECDHLAFRNSDTDWQIWVERGSKPIPRKYVITSKAVTGGPQYTLVIRDWKTDAPAADAFAFKAPEGAKKIDIGQLTGIDEVPPGVVKGAKQ